MRQWGHSRADENRCTVPGAAPTIASARPRPAARAASSASTRRARPSGERAQAVLGHLQLDRPWFARGTRVRLGGRARFVSGRGAGLRFHPRLRFRYGPGARGRRLGDRTFAGSRDPGVALPREVAPGFLLGETFGHPDPEADDRPLAVRFPEQPVGDALGGVAAHLLPASPAVKPRMPREEELQVVVDLRHRADRRARSADLVGLVDGHRGRYSVDAVGARPVHPVEELAGVGGERLDVAALPLRVHRVEGERGLAGAAHTR